MYKLITSYKKNASKMRYHLKSMRLTDIIKLDNVKCRIYRIWSYKNDMKALMLCKKVCKLARPFWKAIWHHLIKIICIFHD